MDKPLEIKAQKDFILLVEGHGCKAFRFEPAGNNGYQDVIVFLPFGRMFLIEFKRIGEERRKLQVYRAKELKELGHAVYWADTYEKAVGIFKKEFRAAHLHKESN